jgi:acetyl-CoA C-acetyltransferase
MADETVALVLATCASAVAATSHRHIDVCEVHDFFTSINSISYEGRGFAEQCGGCKIVEAEVTSISGELPVNMSGGLTAPERPVAHGG